jgi:hypothetical protein
LISQQIFNSGALSLVIIMLSGLFVGMVLGLQGFQLLQRFGSEEALGTAATIGLVKELGPGGHRAAVRRPRGHRAGLRAGVDARHRSDCRPWK